MSALESLITALSTSRKLDASTRKILVDFLQASAPVLSSLESAALQDLLQWLAGGGAAPSSLDALDAGQVVALLGVTQQEMDAALEQRRAQVAAARAAVAGLADAALSVVARLVISAL